MSMVFQKGTRELCERGPFAGGMICAGMGGNLCLAVLLLVKDRRPILRRPKKASPSGLQLTLFSFPSNRTSTFSP